MTIERRWLLASALILACGDDDAAPSEGSSEGGDASSDDTLAPSTTVSTTNSESSSESSTSGVVDGSSSGNESSDGSSSSESSTTAVGSSSDDGMSSESSTGNTDTTAPTITITSPQTGGASVRASIVIAGSVEDDVGVAALVHDGPGGEVAIEVADDGTFAATLALTPGANTLSLRARDDAGNEGSAALDVHFGHRISVGNSQAVLLRDGVVHTWGRNELGQLGNGTLEGSAYGEEPPQSDWPVRYELDVTGIVSIVTRQTFMIGLRDDGTVMSWGSNSAGQLGYAAETDCGSNGTSPCRRDPTEVPGVDDVIAVQAGFEHALVLHADGSVSSWGSNAHGQLGYATLGEDSDVATVVPGLTGIVQLAAGSTTSFALDGDGVVWAWGENDQAQLGLGSADAEAHATPVAVAGLGTVVAIAAANTTTYALQDDGSVMAWGRNHAGQAGIGDDGGAQVLVPTAVVVDDGGVLTPLADVVAIAGDGFVGLAQTSDGVVHAWGLGGLGQLGQGYLEGGERDLANRVSASPVAVEPADAALFDIAEIEIGAGGPALALARSGDLFGWGWSFRGSLGLEGGIDAWAYSAALLVFAAV